MAQRILHLVRHGQIDLTTRPPTPKGWLLTTLGREQAQRTGLRLSTLPINTLHCSTYPRALETAQIIAELCGNLPIHASPLLCECVPGLPKHFRDWYAIHQIEPPDKDKHVIPENIRPYLSLWTHRIDFEAVAAGEVQSQQVFETYFQPSGDRNYSRVHCESWQFDWFFTLPCPSFADRAMVIFGYVQLCNQ
ncbi:histidine phosphatase family protein [Cyanobacteria bacterium FACHB-63]|nr:histidine phosphatase family protein [Cyanobacteria bacterium FACHB-63]